MSKQTIRPTPTRTFSEEREYEKPGDQPNAYPKRSKTRPNNVSLSGSTFPKKMEQPASVSSIESIALPPLVKIISIFV